MLRGGECIFNKFINCREQVKCAKCNWNPTYFEHKKEQKRAERTQPRGKK